MRKSLTTKGTQVHKEKILRVFCVPCTLFLRGQRVVEFVEVLALYDIDNQRSGNSSQFASARVGHDDDVHLRRAPGHGRIVLKNERPAAAVEFADDAFEGDISPGAFDLRHETEHFAIALRFEVAVKLLVQ